MGWVLLGHSHVGFVLEPFPKEDVALGQFGGPEIIVETAIENRDRPNRKVEPAGNRETGHRAFGDARERGQAAVLIQQGMQTDGAPSCVGAGLSQRAKSKDQSPWH